MSKPKKRRLFYFTPEQEKQFNLVTVPGTNVNSNTIDARKTGVQALNFLAQEAARRDAEIETRSERKTVKRLTTVGERLRGDNGYSSYMSAGTPMSGRDPALGTIFDWTVGAKGIDALGKTALWNFAKYGPSNLFRGLARNYFINNAFKLELRKPILFGFGTELTPNNLFRTKVYKGGEITDPYSNFVTTDPRYAANYGKVTPYLFESKSISRTTEPMMGYKDPVNMDMFIYNNTKHNPGTTAIMGHDAVTGEFTPSRGIEILNLNPKNLYPIETSEPSTSLAFFERKPVKLKSDRPKFWDGEQFYTPELEFYRRIKRVPETVINKKDLTIEPYSNLALASNTADFTPLMEANIGKFNKLYAEETINRLKGWGYNPDEIIPMEVLGFRVLDKPTSYIRKNAEEPVYLGFYKTKDNVSGTFDPSTNVAFADPTLARKLSSTMFHERNMHGTDNVLEALSELLGAHGIDNYLQFIDKLFFKRVKDPLQPDIEQVVVLPGVRLEFTPEGETKYFVNFEGVGEFPISKGTTKWYEGRSTINELKRKYLYDTWKEAGKPQTLEEVRPQYLEKINNLEEGQTLKDLSEINGYGQTYVALRKNNPYFFSDLKDLLKYGAAYGLPITTGGYTLSKKSGGNLTINNTLI